MRFCFVNMPVEYYSPVSGGAVSTVTAEIAEELLSLGHAVTVVSYTDDQPVHPVGTVVDLGSMPRLQKPFRSIDRITRRAWRRPFNAYEQYRRSLHQALRQLPDRPDVVIA